MDKNNFIYLNTLEMAAQWKLLKGPYATSHRYNTDCLFKLLLIANDLHTWNFVLQYERRYHLAVFLKLVVYGTQ